MTQRLIGIAGFKNSGKTTLIERLVAEFSRRGFKVSTVKHAHHSFDIDHEGRDSYRHRKAGASQVAVVSRARWAIVSELRNADEPPLHDMLAKLEPCDLVIVEGYKRDSHSKIEVRDVTSDNPKLSDEDETVVAVAANGVLKGSRVPAFDRDDVGGLADFISTHVGLVKAV